MARFAKERPRTGRGLRIRSGVNRIEVAILVGILVVGLLLLVPWLQRTHERERRTACEDRLKVLGIGLQNYASANNNAFPPSGTLYQASSGSAKPFVGGYSFLAALGSYVEIFSLYSELPVSIPNGDIDAVVDEYTRSPQQNIRYGRIAQRMNTTYSHFTCPSNTNSLFRDSHANPPRNALTNYKAIGASTRDSLLFAVDGSRQPPYGKATQHPDGAIYPCENNLPIAALYDGTADTITLMETIDDTNSRWMVGAECTMVGLPQASSPTGEKPDGGHEFFAPPGYDIGRHRSGLRSFLAYDFSPHGADAGKYEDLGRGKGPPAYGPSSMHPGVVNAVMADASVRALSKDIDAAQLFFLITRNNGDEDEIAK